jgi:NitT/TauT family transport system substrate-binding protein
VDRGPEKKRFIPLIWLFFLLCLASCQATDSERPDSSSDNKAGRHVVYRLKWLFNASTVGDIWARDKGIFARNGLDVTLKEGGAEHDAIEEMELGRADFGVASADQVLRAASRGADCLVIAQIFQENPLQWIYNSSRVKFNDENPSESLKHLTIGITYGGNDEAIFMALAGRLGLSPDTLHLYAITYDYTPFWKGEVDLWPCYRNTQGISLSQKMADMGEQAGFLDPCRYGIRFVANSLVTSRKFYNRHPETVKLFRKCIIQGWNEATRPENLDRAARLLAPYEKNLALVTLKEQIRATAPLITGHGRRRVGYTDHDAWRQTEEIMYQQGLIKKRVKVEELLLF